MSAIELILCILTISFGLVGTFLFGCIVGLRRRVEVLEEFIESLENSFLR